MRFLIGEGHRPAEGVFPFGLPFHQQLQPLADEVELPPLAGKLVGKLVDGPEQVGHPFFEMRV